MPWGVIHLLLLVIEPEVPFPDAVTSRFVELLMRSIAFLPHKGSLRARTFRVRHLALDEFVTGSVVLEENFPLVLVHNEDDVFHGHTLGFSEEPFALVVWWLPITEIDGNEPVFLSTFLFGPNYCPEVVKGIPLLAGARDEDVARSAATVGHRLRLFRVLALVCGLS